MEKPNVNNLNGIPNFGHGFEEEAVPTESVEPTIDEVEDNTETEAKPKKAKSK